MQDFKNHFIGKALVKKKWKEDRKLSYLKQPITRLK